MKMSKLAMLDTNVLVYADQEEHEHHMAAKTVRDQGLHGEISMCISPQVLSEFFATLTNPRRVLHPLTPVEAMTEVEKYIRARRIEKIYPGAGVLERVQVLFTQHPTVKGQEIFDLFLAATMLANDVQKIYTFNTKDFEPFTEIEVLVPPAPVPAADEDMEQ